MPTRRTDANDPHERAPRYPIDVTDEGVQNIRDKHTPGGTESAGKSIFYIPEGVDFRQFGEGLLRPAQRVPPVYQPEHRRYARVVEAGEFVGEDEFGFQEDVYTVITNPGDCPDEPHKVFNAFPGKP